MAYADSVGGTEESSIRNWEDRAINNPIASIEQNWLLTGAGNSRRRISLGQGFLRTGYSWCHLVPC